MTDRPAEVTEVHSRILKCALEVEDARAYWARVAAANVAVTPKRAFEEYWFGARGMERVVTLLLNFRGRFDVFPTSLPVLGRWGDMDPLTRRLICH